MHRSFFSRILFGISVITISGFSGCTLLDVRKQIVPNPATERIPNTPQPTHKRDLMVFLDGTNNDFNSRTNVRRMFETVSAREDPKTICFYINGVGTEGRILGLGLGLGMKPRILEAYKFLARNYQPGDRVFVFGFSRGAFQARDLCGMLAHCGLYPAANGTRNPSDSYKAYVPVEKIWDYKKEFVEIKPLKMADGSKVWPSVKDIGAKLDEHRKEVSRRLSLPPAAMQRVNVEFLGIWDTVPGTQFTKYDTEGLLRTHPNKPRYKILAYPNIKTIAHAMSLEDVRDKFRPLLMGSALDPKTKIYETWFPGVHSDVGGGYRDSNDMAGCSLNWMLKLLTDYQVFSTTGIAPEGRDFQVFANPLGVRHHSEIGFGNFASKLEIRRIPKGAVIDSGFLTRLNYPANTYEDFNGHIKKMPYEPRFRVFEGKNHWDLDFGKCRREALELLPTLLRTSGKNFDNIKSSETKTAKEPYELDVTNLPLE